MKKLLTPLILLGILTALIVLAWVLNRNGHNVPRQSMNVSAQKLMSDYVNMPYEADKTYTSKIITVTGIISTISRVETKNYINQFDYTLHSQKRRLKHAASSPHNNTQLLWI